MSRVKLANSTLWCRHEGFWGHLSAVQNFHVKSICSNSTFCNTMATSKASMSAPKCRKMKFDPPFDAPGPGLPSARRINIVRQTREAITNFCENDRKTWLESTLNCHLSTWAFWWVGVFCIKKIFVVGGPKNRRFWAYIFSKFNLRNFDQLGKSV